MNREDARRWGAELAFDEQQIAEENKNATLSMWVGVGSILSLLLTCFLGSLFRTVNVTIPALAAACVLLLASVLIFFLAGKGDERWYLVCSLLNHGGIGFAVLVLLRTLGLELGLLQLVLSGVPAAAILVGVVIFFVSGEGQNRRSFLYGGLGALVLLFGFAALRYQREAAAFWLCMGACALLSCAGLGALLWTNAGVFGRSAYKALAVSSFSVYLLALAAAAAALLVMGSGSGSSSKSKSKSKGSAKGGGGSGSGFLGELLAPRTRTSSYRVRHSGYYPFWLWYYTPYTRYSAINRMQGVSEAEKDELRRSYRIRRLIGLGLVVLVMAAVIVLCVRAGR